jgi:antitoxin (DNA-binding transcriptional repressor) of toxin-antitoxin stability system
MKKAGKTRRGTAISATEAAKRFGRLVDRVREERAVYVIERGGRPVAQIGPASLGTCTMRDLIGLLRTRHRLDEAFFKEVETGVAIMNRPAVPEDRWES